MYLDQRKSQILVRKHQQEAHDFCVTESGKSLGKQKLRRTGKKLGIEVRVYDVFVRSGIATAFTVSHAEKSTQSNRLAGESRSRDFSFNRISPLLRSLYNSFEASSTNVSAITRLTKISVRCYASTHRRV